MRIVLVNYKLAGLVLLIALTLFGESVLGIVPLRSTSVDSIGERRSSKEHNFSTIKSSLSQSYSTYKGVGCFARRSCKGFTPIPHWSSLRPFQNVVPTAITPQTNSWSGLTPLQSTRQEVEKLLGPAKDSVGKTFIYDTPAEKVHVWYSDGPCKASEIGQWNVPVGTVLQIRVYPKAIILLRDLQLDLRKYKRIPDPSIRNWAFYENHDDGVMVQTQLENGCEQVEIVTYEPKKEDRQLRCPTNAQQRKQNN